MTAPVIIGGAGDKVRTETKWFVHCGSAGVGLPVSFDNEAEAIARYEEEIAIPSYFGPGHRRQASVTKVTTIVEDVRP